MTETETLIAIEAIRKLKAAYFRCMDLKLWGELGNLFTAEAVFDVRGALEPAKPEEDLAAEPVIIGRDAIVAHVSAGLAPMISMHQGHTPEIEIETADTARGIWPMSDLLVPPPGAPFKRFRGYGHYWERYVRENSVWRIAALKLRRLYVETS